MAEGQVEGEGVVGFNTGFVKGNRDGSIVSYTCLPAFQLSGGFLSGSGCPAESAKPFRMSENQVKVRRIYCIQYSKLDPSLYDTVL